MTLKPCKSCGAKAEHKRAGVVHKIVCTKCFCRTVGQDLNKIISLWNGDSIKEDHANIHFDDNFITSEVIINGKSTGFSMENIQKYTSKKDD